MYLKSLEIQGFKSFPDRITLNFNKGITAVVGPNGSGKSNIGDAVRWVLGEQSSKTLRGAKMEDVIFAGTQFRKPMGFAAVTLTIDNTSKTLQSDADEVQITRKLYRSGDSEYLINGVQVRLKDITELFLDTGLGRDGYSIIGQGRIAEIVSAKSGERRDIFEEAAGIAKFRYRKEEAERRLLQAEDNLVRLRDIRSMLENRVGPLKDQSEKANRFLHLSKERKELEISVWVKMLDDLSSQIHMIDDNILLNQAEYQNLDNDLAKLEEKIQACYNVRQQSAGKIDSLQDAILSIQRESAQWQSEIAVAKNDIDHATQDIESIEKQRSDTQMSSQELELQKENYSKELNILKDSLSEVTTLLEESELMLHTQQGEVGGVTRSTEEYTSRLSQLQIQQSEYRFAITTGESSQQELEDQREQLLQRREELTKVLEGMAEERKEAVEGIRVLLEKQTEVNNRLSGLKSLYEDRVNRAEIFSKDSDDMVLKIREKQHRIKLLEDLEHSLEGFQHSVRVVLKAGRSGALKGILGSVGQLIDVDSKYTVAVETALGGAMQHIIVEDESTAKSGINFLKEQKSGRSTFLPLTSIKGNRLRESGLEGMEGFVAIACEITRTNARYRSIIENLLGRIVIASDLDAATEIAKRFSYRFRIVTLDGQMINAGGSFTGGSSVRSVGVLSRRNEITQLEQEIITLDSDAKDKKEKVLKLKNEADRLRFDMEAEKEQLSQIHEDSVQFQAEERRIITMLEQSTQQVDGVELQISRLDEKMSQQKERFNTASSRLEQCESEILEMQRLLKDSQGRQDNLQQRREELNANISQGKLRQLELKKDQEAKMQLIAQLSENRENLERSLKSFEERVLRQNEFIEECQSTIDELCKKMENSEKTTEDTRKQIQTEQKIHQDAEQEANQLSKRRREYSEQKERFSREESRFQERKNTVQRDYDSIISEMWEQYQITRSEAKKSAQPIEESEVQNAQRSLTEIKNRIRALGTVNVAAIEEYREVSEQFEELKRQLSDVEGAKAELERLINELTDSMRQQFKDSFDNINRNFQKIFVELFGGGRALLVLTDPTDVLTSGIEIQVAPPGKVIKSLSLLSGGEQAFVAIAIYFAILKIKPAPFCILDEIEAALDDVNVVRYAQYLKNFTDTTQFILVTHRRGSMEEADTLYGVTMQEKGISKLLKMEQTDVAEMSVAG